MAAPWYVTAGAGGGGVGTEIDPFTLTEAIDAVAAGETVYVKADANYTAEYATGGAKDCILYILTAGGAVTPIVWQGYKTLINDGGIVTLDANTNTLASAGINPTAGERHNVFKNFVFTGGSAAGFDGITALSDRLTFKNCRFTANDVNGVTVDDTNDFENCLFDNNTGIGCATQASSGVISCVSHTNTTQGVNVFGQGFVFGLLCYGNGDTENIIFSGKSCAINCTIDGENQANSVGIRQDGANEMMICVNNILHDLGVGLKTDSATGEKNIGRSNLFNSNVDDAFNFLEPDAGGVGTQGDVEAAPGFTGEAGDDYTLTGAGAAAKGLDCYYTEKFWDSFIAANNPPTPA